MHSSITLKNEFIMKKALGSFQFNESNFRKHANPARKADMANAFVYVQALFVMSVEARPAVVSPLYRAPFPFTNCYTKLHTVGMAR